MRTVLAVCAALLVSTSALAGKPQPAPTPQGPLMMVDSAGKELGPAVPKDNEPVGQWIVGTYFRYNGDTFAVRFQELDPNNHTRQFEPRSSTVYFSDGMCQSQAYLSVVDALQFTPRLAVVAYGSQPGVPGPRYLFATAPNNIRTGMVYAYGSRWVDGACSGGGNFPSGLTPATFIVDLTTVFQEPYVLK
jgi:hypothetical protein